MVFYYKARPDAGDYTIYMGVDKNENEELIKYGLPEDVWYEHFPLPPSLRLPLYLSPIYDLSPSSSSSSFSSSSSSSSPSHSSSLSLSSEHTHASLVRKIHMHAGRVEYESHPMPPFLSF